MPIAPASPIAPVRRPTICIAISAAGFGPWSPAPWMRPLARSQLRSARTAIAFVHGPVFAPSPRHVATYHLYGLSELHAPRLASADAGAPSRQRRTSASSERPSLGKLGVPVLPASQSMSRQRLASKTCSQPVRAVPARWLYDRPLRITSAASRGSGLGSAGAGPARRRRGERIVRRGGDAVHGGDEMRARHRRFAVRRRRQRRHHPGDAEDAGARVALAPAFGDDVDDGAALAFLPVVVAQAAAVGTGGAAAQDAGVERCRRHQADRRAELPAGRLAEDAAVGDRGRAGRGRSALVGARERAAEQQVGLAAALVAFAAAGVPAERLRRRLHFPRPAAGGEVLLAAEHAIEKARRVGSHQLAAQAVARRRRLRAASPRARRRGGDRRALPGRRGMPSP